MGKLSLVGEGWDLSPVCPAKANVYFSLYRWLSAGEREKKPSGCKDATVSFLVVSLPSCEAPISGQAKNRPVIVSAELLVATWRDSYENFVLQWVVSHIRELSEESSALKCLFLKHAIV